MRLSFKKSILSSIMLFAVGTAASYAAPDSTRVIVAPSCLLSKAAIQHTTLASSSDLSLIKINKQQLAQLIEAKTAHSKTPCGGFIDVTSEWQEHGLHAAVNAKSFLSHYERAPAALNSSTDGYKIQYETQVNNLLKRVNSQDIWNDLTHLTQFQDRYANSDNGVKAAQWIKSQVETMAKNNNRTDVTVYTVATGNEYKQPSVVMKIGSSTKPGIVIGGHMDTLSSTRGVMPGADDDGSGTSSVLEAARILLASNMHFKKPIYIIWYSAEEMGLVGSKYVVRDFKEKNIAVDAVMQMDMTGYEYKNDPTIWLITDNTNTGLTSYLETLINTYVKQPVSKTRCGYACSDHASWDHAGFTAAFPFEASLGNDDPYIHTSNDTMDVLSLGHMTDFAKLGIAFAVELAEPEAV